MAGLDPQSGSHGGTIDWARFNPDAASDRKWMQIIKMWQLAAFLRDLDAAFRGSDIGAIAVEPPELVLRVSGATEAASRVAARFGVRLEIVAEP